MSDAGTIFTAMTAYDLRIPKSLMELAQKDGFVLTADVVPSAVGLPVSTGMSQEEYDETVERVLDLAVDDDELLPAA
jgi:hypothetical protein